MSQQYSTAAFSRSIEPSKPRTTKMSNDKSEILIEDLPPTVQESLRAELAALYKELHATNQRLQESVNQHLSPALIPTLVQIRAEGIDDVTQSLPDATWLLIRFNGG